MISQADATLGPTTTTTEPITSLNHHIHPHPTSTTIHSAKSSKSLTAKRRKKYEETIIDEFAIIAFKTWEDLQDELNERTSSLNISINNNTNNINSLNNNNNSSTTNYGNETSYETNLIAADKKVKSSKLKCSSNSSSASSADSEAVSLLNNNSSTTTATSTNTNPKDGSGHKKKDKVKKSVNSHSSSKVHVKDKRNKTSSSDTKTTLKRALEAKELAEKRLSIIEEKLKQEQIKNRINNSGNSNSKNNNSNNLISSNNDDIERSSSNNNNINTSKSSTSNVNNNGINNNNVLNSNKNSNIQHDIINQHPIKTSSIHVTEVHYSNPQAPTTHIIKEEIHQHPRANGILSHDLFEDPTLAHKAAPYTPFHINSNLYRPSSVAIHHLQQQQQQQQQIRNAPSPPRIPPHINSLYHQAAQNQQHLPKHTSSPFLQHPNQHSIPSSVQALQYQSAPTSQQPLQGQPTISPQVQIPPNQPHSLYQRPPVPNLIQYQQSQPPMNPYSHSQSNSIMSPMSLSSLPQSYSCSPSIFITDTFSRQTSIIPPPPQALGHVLDPTASVPPVNRFGHNNVPHSITPNTPPVPTPHHMFYSPLPTERSFRELARSYINPGHLGYPNLMNTLPTPTPSTTANPYSLERWSRMTLDHQRAVSIYNSLYQSNTALPDRTFASYASTRPPFPAGPFPPPS